MNNESHRLKHQKKFLTIKKYLNGVDGYKCKVRPKILGANVCPLNSEE